MLSKEDIEAFEDENRDNFVAAGNFVRKFEEGWPADRFGSTDELKKVAKAVRAYWKLLAIQSEALANMMMERRMFDETSMSIGEKEYADPPTDGSGPT